MGYSKGRYVGIGIAVSAAMLLALIGAAAVTISQDDRTIERLTDSLLAAFETADLKSLRTREELGMKPAMDRAVDDEGLAELRRRLELLQKAARAGEERYNEAVSTARVAGIRKFEALPKEEQKLISTRSLLTFYAQHSGGALTADEKAVVPDEKTLLELLQNRPSSQTWAFRLAPAQLLPEERQAAQALADRLLAPNGAKAELSYDESELKYRLQSAGMARLSEIQREVANSGGSALSALPEKEQRATKMSSKYQWVFTEGKSALDATMLAAFPTVEHFYDEEKADEVKRRLGIDTLEPKEREDVDEVFKTPGLLDGERTAVKAFVEAQGVRIVSEKLRTDFGAGGGYDRDRTAYFGRQARSLLRTSVAVAKLEDEPGVGLVKEPVVAEKEEDVTKDEPKNPAARWLGSWVFFRAEQGKWKVVGNGNDKDARVFLMVGVATNSLESILENVNSEGAGGSADAELQALNLSAGISFISPEMLILLALIGLAAFVIRRNPWSFGDLDFGFVGFVVLLAAAQHLFEGQVNLDDWFVTPLVLAGVVVYGAFAGTMRGALLGGLSALVLYGGAVLFHLPYPMVDTYATAPLGEFVLFGATAAILGGAAGRIGWWNPACGALPLIWIVGAALLQRDVLMFPATYGHAAAAALVATLFLTAFVIKRIGGQAQQEQDE